MVEVPGGPRSCTEFPGVHRSSPELPDMPRSSKEFPGVPWHAPEFKGGPQSVWSSPELHRVAWSRVELCGYSELSSGHSELSYGCSELSSGYSELGSGYSELSSGYSELSSGYSELHLRFTQDVAGRPPGLNTKQASKTNKQTSNMISPLTIAIPVQPAVHIAVCRARCFQTCCHADH